MFSFQDRNLPEKSDDGNDLPSEVINRRNAIDRTRMYAKLIINGRYVSETKKVKLSHQ
jgi:hypothetical protein